MSQQDLDHHLRVIQDLADHPDSAHVPTLVAYLEHEEPRAVWAAAWALDRVFAPEAADPLVEAVARVDLHLDVFVHLRGLPAVERLVALLDPIEDWETAKRAARAARALAHTCDERAVEPLRDVLRTWPVLRNAGGAGDVLAIHAAKVAREILAHRFESLVEDALDTGLQRLEPSSAGSVCRALDDPKLVARLEYYLDAQDPRVRRRAVAMLVGMKAEEAAAPLRRAVHDPEPQVSFGAVQGLKIHADVPAVTETLVEALGHPDEDVRNAAARILGERNDPRAHAQLWALRDDCPYSRRQTWLAMARTARSSESRARVLGFLTNRLGPEPEKGSHIDALHAIRALGGEDAADLLARIQCSVDEIERVLTPEQKASLESLRSLSEAEDDSIPRNDCSIVDAAGNLACDRRVSRDLAPALMKALKVRKRSWHYGPTAAVAIALGKTGEPEALPHLLGLLEEPEMTYSGNLGLKALLGCAAGDLPSQELRRVAGLPDEMLHRMEWFTAGFDEMPEIEIVNLAPIKQLASEELSRRSRRRRLEAQG